MSFGCSPSDILKLLEFSTRVYLAFKDANENSEAQVAGLVAEFSTFHTCLTELADLMKEYGKPMPFPCKDFEVTLEKCVKTVEPYAENLVDKKMGIKKIIYTIRYMGTEKEIDGLRKQIMGHYQALNMCISFLQLRLHLEATKQTQRLLDVTPFRTVSIRNRSYSTNALGNASQDTPLALPAPDEHPLYSDWRMFDQWLQSEDERVAQEAGLARPLSLGDTPAAGSSGDIERAFVLYQLRQQVDDAIILEENRTKRTPAEQRSHLSPSDAMKQKVQNTAPAPVRTYTLDTDHSFKFSGFDPRQMSASSATLRGGSRTPSPTTSPSSSPRLESSYFRSTDQAHSPTDSVMSHDAERTYSVFTNRSSYTHRPPVSGLGIATAATTPEDGVMHSLQRKHSSSSLVTLALGESALAWKSLSHKVMVERVPGRERAIVDSRECDIHWQYRKDMGITLRAVYRSSKDNKIKPWTTQHFPATGPSIPLTTTYADSMVSIDFPRGSFGRLDKHLTDIKYTFPGFEAAEKFQTLLYTNNGTDAAELKFDRPILSIASNKNPTECRARNLRLWLRTETHLEQEVPVTFNVLVLLFYTSALEDKDHWVEEPHYAFEWLTESTCKKETDKLTLVFSKDAAKWTPHKLLQRRKPSKGPPIEAPPKSPLLFSRKRNDSMEIPGLTRIDTGASVSSSAMSIKSAQSINGRGSMASQPCNENRFGYSELEIKFQNKKDRRDFVDTWQQYVKELKDRA